MKKFNFIFAILLIGFSLTAQTAIGIKGGIQSTKIYEKSGIYDPTLRTNLGLVCNFSYTSAASFQMELNYSRKGSNVFNSTKATLGYLELPLLLKISGGKEKFKVFGLAGPYIAAPLRSELIVGDEKTVTTVSDDSNLIEKMDVGFHIGGGVTYKMGPGRLLTEIRYCKGYGENFIEDSFNTNAWQLNVGYLFTFGE